MDGAISTVWRAWRLRNAIGAATVFRAAVCRDDVTCDRPTTLAHLRLPGDTAVHLSGVVAGPAEGTGRANGDGGRASRRVAAGCLWSCTAADVRRGAVHVASIRGRMPRPVQ